MDVEAQSGILRMRCSTTFSVKNVYNPLYEFAGRTLVPERLHSM